MGSKNQVETGCLLRMSIFSKDWTKLLGVIMQSAASRTSEREEMRFKLQI
jgi:hypothetical protein